MARRGQPRQDRALDPGTHIAQQQHGDVAIEHLHDDGVVIAHALPLPVRHRRMQHPDARAAHGHLLPCLPPLDERSAGERLAEHLLERRVAGDGNAFPQLDGREVIDDRAGATDVVRIAVREQHASEAAYPASPERWRQHPAPHIKRAVPERDAAGIDQHGRSIRELHKRRVPLPHIEDRDAKRGGILSGAHPPGGLAGHNRDRRREQQAHAAGAADAVSEQRHREAKVVRRHEDERRGGHPGGQPGCCVDETRAAHQPACRCVRDPSGRRRDRLDLPQARDDDPANLDERHQRHRGKIEHKPCARHPRKGPCTDGQ